MFDAAHALSADTLLMGVILSLVFGVSAGNYACSLVHRLPRGLGILEKKPYCGSCNTMLATKDLFPVVSALLLNHRCRYCAAPIPKTHFYTELLLGALFVLCFLHFGFSEAYFLVALLGSMLTVLGSIETNEGTVDYRVLGAVGLVGLMLRILQDATLYDSLFGALLGLMCGCVCWRARMEKRGHIFVPPLPALLLAVGGMISGATGLPVFLPGFAVLAGLQRLWPAGRRPLTVPFGFAAITSVFANF